MDKSILITGHRGFIGRRINGRPFEGDICSSKDVRDSIKGIKGIVHLAAVSNSKDCEENPYKCIHSNIFGTYNILNTIKDKKIWLLFISTFRINKPNLYGLTKLIGEELCRLFINKYRIRIKILRLPMVYGPDDKPYKTVTKIINQLKAGKKVKIDTDEKFDFTYVDDVAKMIQREINVIKLGTGKKITLTKLEEGIRKCLNHS